MSKAIIFGHKIHRRFQNNFVPLFSLSVMQALVERVADSAQREDGGQAKPATAIYVFRIMSRFMAFVGAQSMPTFRNTESTGAVKESGLKTRAGLGLIMEDENRYRVLRRQVISQRRE